jgi:hypothetical protein
MLLRDGVKIVRYNYTGHRKPYFVFTKGLELLIDNFENPGSISYYSRYISCSRRAILDSLLSVHSATLARANILSPFDFL